MFSVQGWDEGEEGNQPAHSEQQHAGKYSGKNSWEIQSRNSVKKEQSRNTVDKYNSTYT